MLRFRLFGIPFEVGPYFWILSACFGSYVAHGDHGLQLLALWVACVFVSIVVHELGHALMARRFGLVPIVRLHGLGGSTYMPGGGLSRPQAILVTLGGPVAGLALWALTQYGIITMLGSSPVGYVTFYAVNFLVFINLYWTLFNLLPILPLDGGQLVRNVVGPSHLFFARTLGGTVAAIASVLCFVFKQPYAAVFLALLAVANFRSPANTGRAI